jgi:hypothetical protein
LFSREILEILSLINYNEIMLLRMIYKLVKRFFLPLAAVLIFLISCSNTKPEITFGFIQLILYQGDTRPEERFSFFIIPNDEDGLDNLDELYLYHDREQLRWVIKNDEWINYTRDGTSWIGTRSIALQNDQSLPRGQYRAVLYNKSGEKDEKNFTFDGEVRFPFPEVEIIDEMYIVKSEWPKNYFICYNSGGDYAATIELQSLQGNLSDLRIPSTARTAALWADDADYYCSAYTNVFSVR